VHTPSAGQQPRRPAPSGPARTTWKQRKAEAEAALQMTNEAKLLFAAAEKDESATVRKILSVASSEVVRWKNPQYVSNEQFLAFSVFFA